MLTNSGGNTTSGFWVFLAGFGANRPEFLQFGAFAVEIGERVYEIFRLMPFIWGCPMWNAMRGAFSAETSAASAHARGCPVAAAASEMIGSRQKSGR